MKWAILSYLPKAALFYLGEFIAVLGIFNFLENEF